MSDWSEVVAGAFGGGLVLIVQAVAGKCTSYRDGEKIVDWLKSESEKPGSFDSRSTRAISKAVSMTPERVTNVCFNDVRIDPVLGERDDLWTLSGKR